MNLHPIYTEEHECQDCYKCVRECPVKAIRLNNGKASIIEDECVLCGHCVRVCPVHAKKVRNDLERVISLLETKDKVIVSLAPSFRVEFSDFPVSKLIAIFKRLGFYGVSETAIGAEELSANLAKYISQSDERCFISTACPVVVEYIRKYFIEYAKFLTPFLSPVLSHCKILKKIYGSDIGVVFVGPCIAKKREADTHPELLDVALTFEELRLWMDIKKDLVTKALLDNSDENTFIPYPAREGRLYPMDGGMISTIKYKCSIDDINFMSFSGIRNLPNILEGIDSLQADSPVFLELLACEGGCINGPKMSKGDGLVLKRRSVISYARVDKDIPKEPSCEIMEEIKVFRTCEKNVSEEQIIEALHSIGKYRLEDELNCGGCGYDSCRDFAKAIVLGKAEPIMCVSYMRKLAQRKANALINAMPCGVVIVDRNLRIVEANYEFARLIGEEEFYKATQFNGALLDKLVTFSSVFRMALELEGDVLERDIRYKDVILHLIVFNIEPHKYVGGIVQDVTNPFVKRDEVIKRTQSVIEKNLSTVQKIAFLLGESAADIESILSSIIELFKEREVEEEDINEE